MARSALRASRCFLKPPDRPVHPDFSTATNREAYLSSRLTAEQRAEYKKLNDQIDKDEKIEQQRLDRHRDNWFTEALLRQQPAHRFLSLQEKRLQAEHAVNRRIENAMAEHRVKARQQRMEFLEHAEKSRTGQKRLDKDPLPEADRQKLKDAYRRAADRRTPPGHDRGKGREGR